MPVAAFAQQDDDQAARDFVEAFGIACLDGFNDFLGFDSRLAVAGFSAPDNSSLRRRGTTEIYVADGPNRADICSLIGPDTEAIAVANAVIAELARRSISMGEITQRGRRIEFPVSHQGATYSLRVEPSFSIMTIVILRRL